MKVGILTFPNSISYGACMQMLALYSAVERLGYDVEVINYHNSFMRDEKHIGSQEVGFVSYFKKQIRKVAHKSLYNSFKSFEEKNIRFYPEKAFYDTKQFKTISSRYDAIICGSDQVWNPNITDSDLSYFLDFCSLDTRRISYAPSFGIVTLPEDFSTKVSSELLKFYAVSVREEAGKKIVEQLTSKSAELVLDPTFLVDSGFWSDVEKMHPLGYGEYILYFTVSHSDALFKKCVSFSTENNMRMVVIGGNAIKNLKNKNPLLQYATDTKPGEWLYLLRNARYIVTNSFHGTAFSLINKKDFFVEYPTSAVSRLQQIICDLNLESRVVNNSEKFIFDSINYDDVFKVLSQKRKQSLCFLENSLK